MVARRGGADGDMRDQIAAGLPRYDQGDARIQESAAGKSDHLLSGKKYEHCVGYLENARADMFTALENRLEGKTTSRVERLFRTVNMRVNVSKWSTEGALNVTKVRLAYYYNGFDSTFDGDKITAYRSALFQVSC